MLRKVSIAIGTLVLVGLLVVGGCQFTQLNASQPSDTAKWEQIEAQTPAIAVDKKAVINGGEFNKFFPTADGYERVYTQEKDGFAEAKIKQDGNTLAMVSVSDTTSNPSAAAKYENSDRTLSGYPVVEVGSTATSLLVADRLQVKVLSRDPAFTPTDREAWLEKFDLAGLAQLVN
ncbi:hypothetical protein N836_27490 [Leptolyngbya sp. Heron Island J]|uniref:hypothetical protein n=1 Tax=Leptolyngbya sp. Heron Island J TaxID=1385935 RepID=UPI0003B9F4D4|nr:hypothetical protein [Leptolyngbya sp. Heron Island J]ESA32337.1 hypothetical protein N836_27490 [Leptolyngbya sp. Heron Island J]